MKECPKCGSQMSPEGTYYGSKWWECGCGHKIHLHDPYIIPCHCENCTSSQTNVREKSG